jgi:hypothetical protein
VDGNHDWAIFRVTTIIQHDLLLLSPIFEIHLFVEIFVQRGERLAKLGLVLDLYN